MRKGKGREDLEATRGDHLSGVYRMKSASERKRRETLRGKKRNEKKRKSGKDAHRFLLQVLTWYLSGS